MAALLALIANTLSAGLVALFGSWRIVLYGILVSIIGIVVYNLIVDVTEEILTFILGQLQGVQQPDGMPSSAYQFSGLAAYLANHLRLVACFTFIISTIVVKWIVAKIPFIKW